MALPHLTTEDLQRLKNVIEEGVQTQQQIADLREGLKDTVKNLAEDLDMKPKQINSAIRIAFKDSLQASKEEFTEIEELLDKVNTL